MELRTHSVTMFCWCVGTYSVFENADLWFTNTVESPGKSFPKSLHEESVHVATGVEFARTTNFFSWLVDSIEARDLEISPPQAEFFWVFSHVSSGLSKHSAHRKRASEQRKITKQIKIGTFCLRVHPENSFRISYYKSGFSGIWVQKKGSFLFVGSRPRRTIF